LVSNAKKSVGVVMPGIKGKQIKMGELKSATKLNISSTTKAPILLDTNNKFVMAPDNNNQLVA